MAEHPALIVLLARNLVEVLDVPGFVTDGEGKLLFYNEAAGDMLGRRFEEVGRQPLERWAVVGPLDKHGNKVPLEEWPLTRALRQGVAGYRRLWIRGDGGQLVEIGSTAFPLRDETGAHGAVVLFWPPSEGETE